MAINADKFGQEVLEKIFSGGTALRSNKAINAIADNGLGAAEMAYKMFKGKGVTEAFDSTFRHAAKEGEKQGALNIGKIAGSYIGLSAAARVATGGGAYKDRSGNTNLIGVPFV